MFDEADIELQAENILIANGGRLQIGQEGAPFQHKAIITLHGHLRSPELPIYGAKTLAVREGVLDMHGMKHTRKTVGRISPALLMRTITVNCQITMFLQVFQFLSLGPTWPRRLPPAPSH